MTPIRVIIDTVEEFRGSLKDGLQPLDILDALQPLLFELAMSPVILNEEQQAELTQRVHTAFRTAHLIEGVDL